jgi:hypothetical protein
VTGANADRPARRLYAADLAAAKENLAKLFSRWEELEAIKAGTG